MLIKSMDDRAGEIQELERAVEVLQGDDERRASRNLRQRQGGLKGERDAAYLIDFDYAASKNHAVIHDLRLEQAGRIAQIDHLIINRRLDCYVLESKHFHSGIKITEQGEFLRWNKYEHTYEGMESPLEQNQRHIAVLNDVMATLDLPVRMGLTIRPSFHSFVLVSGKARIDRPRTFDTTRVVKVDQIRSTIIKGIDEEGAFTTLASLAKLVSMDTVQKVAEQLVAMHRPVKWRVPTAPQFNHVADAAAAPAAVVEQRTIEGPRCKKCNGGDGVILYGKYGYYFKCAACTENTKIRFECQPGHKPKLRKSGNEFFRDCADCGTSEKYFDNGAASSSAPE